MTNNCEDFKELERIAAGDADAFAGVYNRHRDRVYGFAYRMIGVQTIAEDVTHEAFMVLIQNPERYSAERGSMLTFLCAVARNFILRHFRRRGFEVENYFEDDDDADMKIQCEPVQLATLLERELSEKVNESIRLLPPLQREVIVLREFQELSYEEISIVTETDTNVVKARIYRARQTLAKHLAPYMSVKGESCYELRKNI